MLPLTAAQAVTFITAAGAPDPGPAMGQTIVVDFDNPNAPGYSFTGGLAITSGTTGSAAAPAGDMTSYGYVSSALTPNSATLSTPNLRSISFYWGSIDTYNSLDVLGAGGVTLLTITGSMLPPANGDQGAGITNRRVFITAGAGEVITGLTFTSTGVAYEFDDIAASAVPEPATWAMLIAGFGMVGFASRRRKVTRVLN
ncbi:PEPxxWA-CTERM sorting domain-containing protein [Sandaracinobacteroides saxicola]|uniref:PEP-CTERM sorting domain-containing protein n=1 Tax=Sandaracinobacteroides saxicola TaxID=2759707 RepID=A0A7G5IFI7_9SPHN|nr:PEPxxWA-CTERM sorting domain-containing protein [Sandaracinobacteroides saxicola]QMW22129.1 PEP-CTERM sorting domain-containing protein [Sandaracinobacteroides saxicola]